MFEPFGILNFLKTLLPLDDFSQNPPDKNVENKENFSYSPSADTPQNPPQNSPLEQTKNAPPPENFSAQQNAFTQFMENHDTRVKRTRKDSPNKWY